MSDLLIPKTIRHRSEAHRRFVASWPCFACGLDQSTFSRRQQVTGEPISQCAHIAFAQPRARGMKAGDQFCIPLCVRHHFEFDAAGDGEAWWKARRQNPLWEAERLWCESIQAGRVRPERRAA